MFSVEKNLSNSEHIQQCVETLLLIKAVEMEVWGDDPVGKELVQKCQGMSLLLHLSYRKLATEAPAFYPGPGGSKDK